MQEHLSTTSMFEVVERDARLDLFAAAPGDCAQRLGINSRRLGGIGVLAGRGVPIVEFNRALCFGAVEPVTNANLDEVSEWLRTHASAGWALQMRPAARTPAVDGWLKRHAMTASGTGWAKFHRMTAPGAQVRGGAAEVRLVDDGNADAFGAVVQAGFGLPTTTAKWFAALCGRPGWSLYLAYDGEKPVASGAAFASQGVAWFGIDATLVDWRRRGAQTALIHRRIEDGRSAGLTGFTAETGQPVVGEEAEHTSYSNYRRAGFTPVFTRPNYKRMG